MTWGETAATQREGNGQAKKESCCFRLTSIELFGACLFSPRPTRASRQICLQ
jgi:hypothetical protein